MTNENKTNEITNKKWFNRFGLGAFVYILNKDFSKILLVRRNAEKIKQYGFEWGLVGGKLEPGESLAEGAIRETQEETGITLSENQLKFLYFQERVRKEMVFTGVQFCYAAIVDENSQIVIDEDESDGYQWFPVNELPDNMADSKETIAKALALVGVGQ